MESTADEDNASSARRPTVEAAPSVPSAFPPAASSGAVDSILFLYEAGLHSGHHSHSPLIPLLQLPSRCGQHITKDAKTCGTCCTSCWPVMVTVEGWLTLHLECSRAQQPVFRTY